MSTQSADALTSYLNGEIETGLEQVKNDKNAIRYKQLGLDYIQACKDVATTNDVLDIPTLKQKILDAVNLLQSYHDAL